MRVTVVVLCVFISQPPPYNSTVTQLLLESRGMVTKEGLFLEVEEGLLGLVEEVFELLDAKVHS